MYLPFLCWTLSLVLQRANAALMMQNKLRIERGYVPEETARGVFEAIRKDMIPYPQDAISKKLLTINGDAGESIDFSNNRDKIQTFRDIINEEAEGRVSGILRIQEMKARVYEKAKKTVNKAVENHVMEDGGTIHLYLSRPESSALANHTDVTDIFVLQLVGAKEWILCDNEASRLLDKKLRGKLDKCTTYTTTEMDSLYCERTTLYPGDALYLPKKVVHSARATSDGLSAHLTFGFAENTCSLNEMDICVASQAIDHDFLIDHDQERRRLVCKSSEGGSSCDHCNCSCDAGCDGCLGTCSCNKGCNGCCDEDCDICPPPPTKPPKRPPTKPPTPPPTPPPTAIPSTEPSVSPSGRPSTSPSASPSATPSWTPTGMPTPIPTPKPSPGPSAPPTPPPSPGPTTPATPPPSPGPTTPATPPPSPGPTTPATPPSTPAPTTPFQSTVPTSNPSQTPTRSASSTPTAFPTPKPSAGLTTLPTPPPSSSTQTQNPSAAPSPQPSESPSSSPTLNQTISCANSNRKTCCL